MVRACLDLVRNSTRFGAAQCQGNGSGNIIYIPGAGDVLTPGSTDFSTFIPADAERYLTAQATVTLVVDAPTINSRPVPATLAEIPPGDAANYVDLPDAEPAATPARVNSGPKGKPETRTYKGATYEKGEDGQWHLQQK